MSYWLAINYMKRGRQSAVVDRAATAERSETINCSGHVGWRKCGLLAKRGMMRPSHRKQNSDVNLVERYKPLGIRAVLAATEIKSRAQSCHEHQSPPDAVQRELRAVPEAASEDNGGPRAE